MKGRESDTDCIGKGLLTRSSFMPMPYLGFEPRTSRTPDRRGGAPTNCTTGGWRMQWAFADSSVFLFFFTLEVMKGNSGADPLRERGVLWVLLVGPRAQGPITAFTWSDFVKSWKTEIRMAGQGIEPGSSRMGVQLYIGATVTERIDCSPLTKANQVQVSAGRCRWSVGFIGDLPVLTPFHYGAAPYSPHFTLIGSQDLDFKSRSELFTHSFMDYTYVQSVWSGQGSIPTPSVSPGQNWSRSLLTARSFLKRENLSSPHPAYGVNYCQHESNL
ncbi:hypothetical protein PR048_025421 [Dryococelus australis]|uniref:Uncharacterized protein n=1 Tax=Dryococelus australis TaxID=614101 RepID=A0ABQ9GRC1_9NEOP|nr:hypothetical protein PR048_025421 [Dryococelus australis]